MNVFKSVLLIFIICVMLALGSCGASDNSYDYVFSNETKYTINVYIDKPFSWDESSYEKGTTIVLYAAGSYSASEKKISVRGEDMLDFYWSAQDASDNQNIYTSVSGKKAVFRER